MQNFEDLESWKLSRQLRNDIAILVKKFPLEEKYKLTDQLIRASRSVTANIAEGYGRFHYQENIQFCRHSRGSLNEVLDHLICAYDNSYIDNLVLNDYRNRITHILKILNGYISFLKKKKAESLTQPNLTN
jgi:four helix bundle protein